MRRITLALTFAIIATLSSGHIALGNTASPYCGSSLGPAGEMVPFYGFIDKNGNSDLSAISDIPAAQLHARGIGVARSQYTNPTGWPYSAPVLTWVSTNRSVLVFRFDCGHLVNRSIPNSLSVSALTLGWTEQPNEGITFTLAGTRNLLFVELDPKLLEPGVVVTFGTYGSSPRVTNGITYFETFPVEEYQVFLQPLCND